MTQLDLFGLKVYSPFAIVKSAYPGEYFILVEEGTEWTEPLENIKTRLREVRKDVDKRRVGRYTADEVSKFLIILG